LSLTLDPHFGQVGFFGFRISLKLNAILLGFSNPKRRFDHFFGQFLLGKVNYDFFNKIKI